MAGKVEQTYQCYHCGCQTTSISDLQHHLLFCEGGSKEDNVEEENDTYEISVTTDIGAISDVDSCEQKDYEEPQPETSQISNASSKLPKLVQWNENSSRLLLKIYQQHLEEFTSPHTRKKKVWEKIATILKENHGLGVTALQCENKIKNMSSSYKKAANSSRKCGSSFRNSFLFKELEQLQRKDPIVEHLSVLSSGYLSSNTSENQSTTTAQPNLQSTRTENCQPKHSNKRKLDETPPWVSIIEGMERRHNEKMARYDKIIDILERLANKI